MHTTVRDALRSRANLPPSTFYLKVSSIGAALVLSPRKNKAARSLDIVAARTRSCAMRGGRVGGNFATLSMTRKVTNINEAQRDALRERDGGTTKTTTTTTICCTIARLPTSLPVCCLNSQFLSRDRGSAKATRTKNTSSVSDRSIDRSTDGANERSATRLSLGVVRPRAETRDDLARTTAKARRTSWCFVAQPIRGGRTAGPTFPRSP